VGVEGVGSGSRVGAVGVGALVGPLGGVGSVGPGDIVGSVGTLMLILKLMNCSSRSISISVFARRATLSHKASNCSLALPSLSILRLTTLFLLSSLSTP
jgi:hypothetical protein